MRAARQISPTPITCMSPSGVIRIAEAAMMDRTMRTSSLATRTMVLPESRCARRRPKNRFIRSSSRSACLAHVLVPRDGLALAAVEYHTHDAVLADSLDGVASRRKRRPACLDHAYGAVDHGAEQPCVGGHSDRRRVD